MFIPADRKKGSNILLAGAGGGYDFMCALPIALTLMEQGHSVHLANYSFTRLREVKQAEWLSEDLLRVDARSALPESQYFPEAKLSRWFLEARRMQMPVYCYADIGVRPLAKTFKLLKKKLSIDEIFIVDRGVDGIFRGDEFNLGTPTMDAISIIAGALVPFPKKMYAMTAFGSEGVGHEVSHADVLARIAQLTASRDFYGVGSLVASDPSCRGFLDAVDHVWRRTLPQQHGNIVGSIVKSVAGAFGDVAVNTKTVERPIWVSPLTNLYWYFDLGAVARMKLYYRDAVQTDSVGQVVELINNLRKNLHVERQNIPI